MNAARPIPDRWRRLIEEGRHFCLAPWLHTHVPAFGPASPCCVATGDFGNLPAGAVDQLRHSPHLNSLRAHLLRDQPDPRCANCHRHEALGFPSDRQRFNRLFLHHWPRLAATATDGSIGEARPVSWDLRFSNLCNLRCRTCFHGSSSRWHRDAVALGWTRTAKSVIRSVADSKGFIEALDGDIRQLEFVQFAGGEPMLMREHWQILDRLIALGCGDVLLNYNTNLSRLTVHDRDVIPLWNRFRHVVVDASVDGAGTRGELLRAGFSWRTYAEHARRIRREAPHVDIAAEVTVSVMNVLHLPDLHRRLVEEDVLPAQAFRMHPLFRPEHYAVSALTGPLRREARRRIRRHLRWIAGLVDAGDLEAGAAAALACRFTAVLRLLDMPHRPGAVRAFRLTTAALDDLRGEQMGTVFPELAPMLRPSLRERLGGLLHDRLRVAKGIRPPTGIP